MRIILFVLISHSALFAQISEQNQQLIDSLSVYDEASIQQLDLLKKLSYGLISDDQDTALYYAALGLERAEAINNPKYIGAFLQRAGIAYRVKGEYLTAIKKYKQAESAYGEINDQEGLAGVYNSLGILFSMTKNFPLAIAYFEKLITIDEREGNPHGLVYTYSNLAGIYTDNKELKKAASCYQKALDILQQYQITTNREAIWNNVGTLQLLQNNHDSALHCFEKSLAFSNNNTTKSKMHALLGMGQVLNQKRDTSSAAYLKKAHELSIALGDRRVEADVNLALSEVAHLKNNFLEAHAYLKTYSMMKDSLLASEQIQQINELEIRYETEKKELQLEIEKRKNFYSYLISSCVVLILFLFINRLMAQRKINRITKDRLEKEVDYKNRLLASRAMDLSNHTVVLEDLNAKIDEIKSSNAEKIVDTLKRSINQKLRDINDWTQMKLHFEEVHPEFFKKLEKFEPALTPNELKHCAYIKMKLDNKDMARMLNVNLSSVHVVHHRMKKKLNLSESDSLPMYISSL